MIERLKDPKRDVDEKFGKGTLRASDQNLGLEEHAEISQRYRKNSAKDGRSRFTKNYNELETLFEDRAFRMSDNKTCYIQPHEQGLITDNNNVVTPVNKVIN